MELNRELVERRIREIHDSMEIIGKIVSKRFEDLSVMEILAMRYAAIQLVEASASICVHILMTLLDERPEGYPDCFIRLSEKEILPGDLAIRLASAARLRNLLVHRYWDISDLRVYADVKGGLSDFQEFVSRVRSLMGDKS